MRCPNCHGSSFSERDAVLDFPIATDLAVHVTDVPVLACDACGEKRHRGHTIARTELVVARALFDEGCRRGEALRAARKALGLRASELSRLLDVAPETVSRWENGHSAIDAATWIAVGALVNDALNDSRYTQDRLAALQRQSQVGQLSVSYRSPVPCAQHHIGRLVFHAYNGRPSSAYSEPPAMEPVTVVRTLKAA